MVQMASWLQKYSVEVQAISAIVSALAAVSVATLTFFLVRATNRYVRLVQQQLSLLRAQLAAPLLLDVSIIQGVPLRLIVRCRHSGNPSSLPAIVKAALVHVYPLEGGVETEASEEVSINDILKPGKTWSRIFAGAPSLKIGSLPAPSLWRALFHGGPRQQMVATLSVTLHFQRGGQTELEQVTSEYEVRTRHFGGPALAAL